MTGILGPFVSNFEDTDFFQEHKIYFMGWLEKVFFFFLKKNLLKCSWCTLLYVTGVQYSDS